MSSSLDYSGSGTNQEMDQHQGPVLPVYVHTYSCCSSYSGCGGWLDGALLDCLIANVSMISFLFGVTFFCQLHVIQIAVYPFSHQQHIMTQVDGNGVH